MDQNIESVLAAVNFIKDRMLTKDEGATKDDLQQFERRLDIRFDTLESRVGNIENELRDIRQRLEALDEAAGNASGFATDRAWTVRGAHPLQGQLNTLPPRDLPCLHQIRLSTPVAALTARADSRAARNSDGFFFSAALQVQLTESYYEAD